jgi:uncharacterized protein (TIGR04141 family)
MPRPRTREATLYRLSTVTPTPEGMFDVLDIEKLDEIGADLRSIEIAGAPALWVGGQFRNPVSSWCKHAAITTGVDLSYGDIDSAGLILMAVDGVTYALGYGAGHRLIPDELKDQRFGLRFVIRRVDPEEIQDLVRRIPGARGRTDATVIPGGLPIWTLGVEEHAQIVRRLGGRLGNMKVTFSSQDDRPVGAEGSVGLRMRFGVLPEDLVGDIREVARVCAQEQPHRSLEFVEHIQPVSEPETLAALDADLEGLLGGDDADAALVPVVPTSALVDYGQARSFTIKIGNALPQRVLSLELHDFLRRTRRQRPGERMAALRAGRVQMYRYEDGPESLGGASAIKWLEANLSLGSRRFFLLDGEWYEVGAEYLRAMRAEIDRLFGGAPALDLPGWDLALDREEKNYNASVPNLRPGYVCLDRRGVGNPLGAGSTVEICDLLGPGDELIHVKRAAGSAPLSHLFAQGLVSAQSLLASADVRERFAAKVAAVGKGRTVPADFTPKKVVFAILLKGGEPLTPETLFPFSQVTLAHASRILRSYQIEVEVIGVTGHAAA